MLLTLMTGERRFCMGNTRKDDHLEHGSRNNLMYHSYDTSKTSYFSVGRISYKKLQWGFIWDFTFPVPVSRYTLGYLQSVKNKR